MRGTLITLIAVIAANPLDAQAPTYRASVALRPESRTPALHFASISTRNYQKSERFVFRLFTGTAGLVAGAYAGAYASQGVGGQCDDCDDPGLGAALIGAAIGGVLGTGIGAGAFALQDTCSTGERIAMGMGGAAVGGILGLLGGPLTNGYSVPAGSVILGAAMTTGCTPKRAGNGA